MSEDIKLINESDGTSATFQTFIKEGKMECPFCRHEFSCEKKGEYSCGNCGCYFFADDLSAEFELRRKVYAIE